MAELTIPLIEKAAGLGITPAYQEFLYIWDFKNNIQSLSNAMDNLETTRETINSLIVNAKRNAETIRPDVEEWLQKVELMKNEVDRILDGSRNAQLGCMFNCCCYLKDRYSLGKEAATKTIEIAELQGKGDFSQVGYPAPIGQGSLTSHLDVIGFESRRLVEEDVMKALLDDNIPVIAVCGMGGVGKTTLVKKIADEVKKEKYFDEVALAVVSQKYQTIEVQQQLAERLGLEIKETTVGARADRLRRRLMDQGKRILLIIDDIWEEIKLGDIGIPSEFEGKGLKVILTSRNSRVCTQMNVTKIIPVDVLIKEEAWVLFKKHANITDDDSVRLVGIPKKMADKCHGLPLAIEVIGKTLKDRKQLSEWRDALLQLESAQDSDTSEDVYVKVYSSIAWSVNYLGSQRRSLLLLCSLFPEDYEIEIEDLVRYAKGLQLLEGIEKMNQTRDRVGTIIQNLTDCYLLISCDNNGVKLHDVVRDTCLSIASKGENVFMVSHSILREWPDKETYESYTAISLHFDDFNGLPTGLNFSRLQFLRLTYSGRNKGPFNLTGLLEATGELRVLHIKDFYIEMPPRSVQTSMNLRTLNLHGCSLKGDLSALLESLLKVEVLSFFDSIYEGKRPKEIAKLSNLKSLDLRFFPTGPRDSFPRDSFPTGPRDSFPRDSFPASPRDSFPASPRDSFPRDSFPTGILIHLKKLEELYLGEQSKLYEITSEIGSLSNLNTICVSEIDSPDLGILVDNLDVDRLSRFYINQCDERSQYQFNNTMIVAETNMGMLLEPKMKALLSKVETLALDGVTGFNNDFDGGSVFCRPRFLELRACDMKYMCNSTNSVQGVFVNLKLMVIEGAKHLEELCHGNIPPGSFASLEEVYLVKVPLLRCLWGPIEPPCLGNLTTLVIHGSEVIRSLFLRSSVKCFARLQFIYIVSCPKLETLVSSDDQKETIEEEIRLPELRRIKLKNLPKLRMLSEVNVDFQKLLTLTIWGCGGLQYLLTPPMVKMFVNLKELEIYRCDQMESIIGSEEDDKVATIEEVIELPKLRILALVRLPKLRMLCSNPVSLSLPYWNKFYLYNCPRINRFCAGNLIAPELKQVSFIKDLDEDQIDLDEIDEDEIDEDESDEDKIDEIDKDRIDTDEIDVETTRKWFKDCELGKRCIECSRYAAFGAALGKEVACDHLSEGSSNQYD